MIRLNPGSLVHQILTLLSVAGEFPAQSLAILGNERVVKRTVHRLESTQDIRSVTTGNTYSGKLLQVSGSRNKRTVRLYKGALPVLTELHPDSLGFYMDSFRDHKFSGGDQHIWRNHRVAEPLAMCMAAGIEFRPYALPQLQSKEISPTRLDYTGYYVARSIKKLDIAELNKSRFTRLVGTLFYPGGCYAAYNTRDALMKWSGNGEESIRLDLGGIARQNGSVENVDSALLFGANPSIALETLIESDTTRQMKHRFDRIYYHIHFIPMDQNGVRLLRILSSSDWRERLMGASFQPEMRPSGHGFMEFDAYWENTYIYSHLDSDIARLIRFSAALEKQKESFEVMCFPWQVPFLKEYLGDRVKYKVVPMDNVLAALNL